MHAVRRPSSILVSASRACAEGPARIALHGAQACPCAYLPQAAHNLTSCHRTIGLRCGAVTCSLCATAPRRSSCERSPRRCAQCAMLIAGFVSATYVMTHAASFATASGMPPSCVFTRRKPLPPPHTWLAATASHVSGKLQIRLGSQRPRPAPPGGGRLQRRQRHQHPLHRGTGGGGGGGAQRPAPRAMCASTKPLAMPCRCQEHHSAMAGRWSGRGALAMHAARRHMQHAARAS